MNSTPRLLLVCLIVVACLAGGFPSAHAQPALYTLASPEAQSYGRFGESIGAARDVNSDDVPDVIVGAPSEGGESLPGRAYVFSGASGDPLRLLSSDEPQKRGDFGFGVAGVAGEGTAHIAVSAPRESAGRQAPRGGNLYIFEAASGDLRDDVDSPNEGPNGRLGFSLRSMPDFDGDGIRDFALGAPSEGITEEPPTTGRAYVLSGDDGDDLLELTPPREGIRLFGYAVAGMPDVNGGGTADVAVGAVGVTPTPDRRYAGATYVYSGEDGRLLLSLTSPNEVADGRFGSAIASIGDTNGDGIGEVVVGAPGERADAGSEVGRAYVFSGANGELLHTLVSPNAQSNGRFGEAVSGGLDVNRDGAGDLLVGAPSEASSAGRVYVFSGADGSLLRTMVSPNEAINGGFGSSVAVIGDVDEDGIGDVAVGATGESAPDGTERSGTAYVFSGAALGGEGGVARE
jgi:hypothetical protein